MCLPALPLALIGGALAAGGMGMQYAGQKKADHALSSTFNAERARQHAFEAQQAAKFQDSLNSTANVADPAAMAAATSARENVLNTAVAPTAAASAGAYLPGASSAPSIVATEGKAAGQAADARTSSLAHAIASMGGMSDLMQNNDINIGRNGQSIGQIGGFMRGSLDALQPEMDAAKLKGQNLRTLGSLAQSIGMAAMSGGIGGGGAGLASKLPVNIGAMLPAVTGGIGSADFSRLPGMAV